MVLDRTELRRVGTWSDVSSWTATNPTLVGLRLLRAFAFLGSAGVLMWLAALAVLCIPARTRQMVGAMRVPGATLVRAALVGSVAIAAIGVSGPGALAERRSITATHDATGGQRWPQLTQPRNEVPRPTMTSAMTSTAAAVSPPSTELPLVHVEASTPTVSVAPPSTAGPAVPMVVAFRRTQASTASTLLAVSTPSVRQHVVMAGESFWSIAEEHVLREMDEASNDDVAQYWQVLVEVNRSGLPDPANPDLLWVGAELTLPPLPGSTALSLS